MGCVSGCGTFLNEVDQTDEGACKGDIKKIWEGAVFGLGTGKKGDGLLNVGEKVVDAKHGVALLDHKGIVA